MYTVAEASPQEFRDSRAQWNALTAVMAYPTVFCSWEWIYTWWEHFGAGRAPRVLFIRRDGELVGILPLFCQRQGLRRDGKIGRVLGYCGVPELFPDPLDVIAAAADAPACVAAGMNYLAAQRTEWDVLHLRFMAADSALMRALPSDAPPQQVSAAPYIPVAGGYEGYLQTLSSNERSNVRRRRRKLLEGQGVVYTNFAGEDPQQVLRYLFDLHARRADQKSMHSTFSGPRIEGFHDELLRRLGPSHVWLRGLRRDKDVLAVFYGYAAGGRVFYYQLGYDPEWSDFSPGSVLLQETIREAFDSGYTEYNFLQGEEGFKYRWTRDARALYAQDVFNRSLCGHFSRMATAAKRLLKSKMEPKKTDKAVAIVTDNT